MGPSLMWQPSLLGESEATVEVDPAFAGLVRHNLDATAWVDLVPGWLLGADALFDRLLRNVSWQQRNIRMYERDLPEPRLTRQWILGRGVPEPVFVEAARLLSERYEKKFTQVGVNLYRDGNDSVAWHGDRVAREMDTALVGLISLGGVRPLRLRPTAGGSSVEFSMRPGDLVVMGGSCQRAWQHSVPKVRSASARISVQFRHVYGPRRVSG